MPGTQTPGAGKTAATYTIIGSFLGGAAGGGWLGLILMSVAGLYGSPARDAPWEDLVAGSVAAAALVALAVLAGRAAGRIAFLRVIFTAAVATLNVVAVLYLFGEWVCQIPPPALPAALPASAQADAALFAECRIQAPFGGIGVALAALLLSPSILAALIGALLTLRRGSGR